MSLQDTYPCDCGERVDLNHNYCPNCGDEIDIDWPLEFTMSATGDAKTTTTVEENNLPHSDDICEALYHYPGEVVIHYEMDEDLNVEPTKIEYEGETWVPK